MGGSRRAAPHCGAPTRNCVRANATIRTTVGSAVALRSAINVISAKQALALLALATSALFLAMIGSAGLSPARAEAAIFAAASDPAPELDPTIAALADYARDKLPGAKGALNFSPALPGFSPSDPDFAAAHAGLNLGPHGAGVGVIAHGSNSRPGSAHGGSAGGRISWCVGSWRVRTVGAALRPVAGAAAHRLRRVAVAGGEHQARQ